MTALAAPPTMPSTLPVVLSAHDVTVQFPKLLAVDHVSFDLRGGELLGLIGPNGAGKTTLLRAIAGLQPLTSGRVTVFEQEVRTGAGEVQRVIGFTPDTPSVYEELTVRQFLQFIARGYDLAGVEVNERIDFWLEKVWLTEKSDQKIKQLSRGMRQRIGIARTLLANPVLVLLDEPAAGLDPAGRVQFRQLLANLRDQGKAIIISSHILSDMNEYCTHIGIMSSGAMVQFGTVAQVTSGDPDARRRYTFTLARPAPDVLQQLAGLDGISNAGVDRDRVTLEAGASPEQAARILAELVHRGLPIASFAPLEGGLEDAYLRSGVRQVD